MFMRITVAWLENKRLLKMQKLIKISKILLIAYSMLASDMYLLFLLFKPQQTALFVLFILA